MNTISEIEKAINKSIEEMADDEIEKAMRRLKEQMIAQQSNTDILIMTNICIYHNLPS